MKDARMRSADQLENQSRFLGFLATFNVRLPALDPDFGHTARPVCKIQRTACILPQLTGTPSPLPARSFEDRDS